MAKNEGKQQQREDNAQQGVGTASAQASNTGTARASSESASDRERSIETRREGLGQSGSLARRQQIPSVYGPAGTPFSLMRRMMEDMDRLFENFGVGRTGLGLAATPGFGLATSPGIATGTDLFNDQLQRGVWSPQVETFRQGDNLVIRADLPGLRKEDVDIELNNDILTISGDRRDEHEENRDGYYRSERTYGQFYRAIPLPEGVNAEQSEASFKDGVLEVTIPAPNVQEQQRKRIPIR
jgi:HSP20 family protein